MKRTYFLYLLLLVWIASSCKKDKDFDATGYFEAEEVVISSQANGILKEFRIEEGRKIDSGTFIGYVDSTQLSLQKEQLLSQLKGLGVRLPDIRKQTAYFDGQIQALNIRLQAVAKDKQRIENLYKQGAASQKQLDDLNNSYSELSEQVQSLQAQKAAKVSGLSNQSGGLSADKQSLWTQVKMTEEQLKNSKIIAKQSGTILNKYMNKNELVGVGMPLYRMANLDKMILRAYISGDQLPNVKLNQQVKVYTDDGNGGYKEQNGTIQWISSQAEFTPKSIQTKDERALKVYAIKVAVDNPDDLLKIGMYGQITFE